MFQKFLTTFLMAIMFAVTIPAFAGTASAQRRDNDRNRRYSRDNNRYNNDRNYDNRTYDNTNYNDQYYEDDYYYDQYGNKKPNVYDRHRKAINLGVATGAGAVINTAEAKVGVTVELLNVSNAILGTATTDDQGYARFDAGLTRGTGGSAPAMVVVKEGTTDIAFLSLTDPEFDLSDRGVEGREAAPPVDVFVTTDRGAYRAGETVYVTSASQAIFAVNAATGKLLWRYDTATILVTRPALEDGTLYFVASADPQLYALEAQTGKLLWKQETGDWPSTEPVIAGSALYLGGRDGSVVAYRLP